MATAARLFLVGTLAANLLGCQGGGSGSSSSSGNSYNPSAPAPNVCAVGVQLISVQSGGSCSSSNGGTGGASPSAGASPGASGGGGASCSPAWPSAVILGTPSTVSAQITGYGWPDNSPPGGALSNPILHQTAGGTGTYCDPISFATEPAEDATFPHGTRIYVPFLQRYFIREDDCTNSGPAVNSGSNGCSGIWFDLWVGGTGSDSASSIGNCEDSMTKAGVQVTVNPPSGLAVTSGPIYNNGTCNI